MNLSPAKVKVTWNEQRWYGELCYGCGADPDKEFKKTLILDPNETKFGICAENSPKELFIFSKMLDFEGKGELSNFNFTNLTITPIN